VNITFTADAINGDTVSFNSGSASTTANVSLSITAHSISLSTGSISVPKGGCSANYTFSASAVPMSNVNVVIEGLLANNFYILNQTQTGSDATVQFNGSSGLSIMVKFCSRGNSTLIIGNTYSFPTILNGTNATQYAINNNVLPDNINLQVTAAATPGVTFASAVNYPNGTTYGTQTVISQTDGTLYY
jgi:hypothetical protein